jgi:hydrogenase maturation protein HypF
VSGRARTRDGRRPVRSRIRVEGTVQGVGFRPHAYRLATGLGLAGFVRNDPAGVLIEVEGDEGAVAELVSRLGREAPALARVERVAATPIEAVGETGFAVLPSAGDHARGVVAADAATCDACLAELFDPADRRHRYPFVNCTDCGPRLTIVRGAPYDRARTTMASFEMCAECRAEFEDPADRRFEAQANACPRCGPRAALLDRAGRPFAEEGPDALALAAAALRRGEIVAVKGIGGYHLACLGADEEAVRRLREGKRREERPFALMVAGVQDAAELVELREPERRLIAGAERPIVIAPRRDGEGAVADGVAPRCPELGVMLAYSPLHHLLLADVGAPLVMTSANVADEPIAYRDEDALRRLGGIADAYLVHDRPIANRVDDSVARAVAGRPPLILRRSRGRVPAPLPIPVRGPAVLAVGPELKSTFCLAAGGRAWVSHHLGDLRSYETLIAFREGVERFGALLGIRPDVVAHDLHPDYLSTSEALAAGASTTIAVQHHHAHLAACLAEHGERRAVGAILDGAGLGPDGSVWGGEILTGDLGGYERVGSLLPVALPGGDAAAREPWRMACAWLRAVSAESVPALPAPLARSVSPADWERMCAVAGNAAASPVTTSAGRLFDAVAALCGLSARAGYEGQAAAALEWAADRRERRSLPLPLVDTTGSRFVLDAREAVAAIGELLAGGAGVGEVSARFHNALAGAIGEACARAAEASGTDRACLGGGVFQNALLVERTTAALASSGLRVLVPERLPPNDGAISYGQVAVALATLAGVE